MLKAQTFGMRIMSIFTVQQNTVQIKKIQKRVRFKSKQVKFELHARNMNRDINFDHQSQTDRGKDLIPLWLDQQNTSNLQRLSINLNSPPRKNTLIKNEDIALTNEIQKIKGLSIKSRLNSRKIKEIADKEAYIDALQKGHKSPEQTKEKYQDPAIKRLQRDVEKTLKKIENSRK